MTNTTNPLGATDATTTSKRLVGKQAVVTAAAQGIGRATALAFAQQGASVVATDINQTAIEDLAKTHQNITPAYLDVTDDGAVHKLLSDTDKIDVLFNCAGFVHSGSILNCALSDWDFSHNLNVKSMYRTIRTTIPLMIKHGGGSIINMSSVASSLKGVRNRFVYSVTKAAVIGLTKSIAADFIDKNIRCNAICPGTVDSPSLHDRLRATGNYQQAQTEFIARQPMGRIGTAQEIAALAVYLASDESAFTTGQTHIIDGGWAM